MSTLTDRIARLNESFDQVSATLTIPSDNALSLVSTIRDTIHSEATRQLRNSPSMISADDITHDAITHLADSPSCVLAIAAYVNGDANQLALIRRTVRNEIVRSMRREGMVTQSKRVARQATTETVEAKSTVRIAMIDPKQVNGSWISEDDASFTTKSVSADTPRTLTTNRGSMVSRTDQEASLIASAIASDGPAQPIDVDAMRQLIRLTETDKPVKRGKRESVRVNEYSSNLPREWRTETGEIVDHRIANSLKESGKHVYRMNRFSTLKGETRLVREKSLEDLLTDQLRFDSLSAKLSADHFPSDTYDASLLSVVSDAHRKSLFRSYFTESLSQALAASPNTVARNIETVVRNIKLASATVEAKKLRDYANVCQTSADQAASKLDGMTKTTPKAKLAIAKREVRVTADRAENAMATADLATYVALTIARNGAVTLADILNAITDSRDTDTRQRIEARDHGQSTLDIGTLLAYLGGKRDTNGRPYRAIRQACELAADMALDQVAAHSDHVAMVAPRPASKLPKEIAYRMACYGNGVTFREPKRQEWSPTVSIPTDATLAHYFHVRPIAESYGHHGPAF